MFRKCRHSFAEVKSRPPRRQHWFGISAGGKIRAFLWRAAQMGWKDGGLVCHMWLCRQSLRERLWQHVFHRMSGVRCLDFTSSVSSYMFSLPNTATLLSLEKHLTGKRRKAIRALRKTVALLICRQSSSLGLSLWLNNGILLLGRSPGNFDHIATYSAYSEQTMKR